MVAGDIMEMLYNIIMYVVNVEMLGQYERNTYEIIYITLSQVNDCIQMNILNMPIQYV